MASRTNTSRCPQGSRQEGAPDRLAGLLRIRAPGSCEPRAAGGAGRGAACPTGAIRAAGTRERSPRASSATASTGRSWSIAARWRCWLATTRWLRRSELGWTEIAATFVDVDEEQAKRIVLVDNRSNDLAGYDDGLLAELLEELPDLDGTGYDLAALDALLDELGRPTFADEDELPAPPTEPTTRPGDLYRARPPPAGLRRRRATPSAYERLLGAERARLVWTDPPYGVDYEGKTEQRAADRKRRRRRPRGAAARRVRADRRGARPRRAGSTSPIPPGRCRSRSATLSWRQGWRLRQTLVWVKDAIVLGHADYHYRHEPILYGYKPGARAARPRRQRLVRRQHADVGARGRAPARLARAPDDEAARR